MSLPHDDVYVRLQPSKVGGVGVFAIRAIPKGTEIFKSDALGIAWVDERQIANLKDLELRRLYHDFGIRSEGRLGCPINFNSLTVGWYLNQPEEGMPANVETDDEYRFFAARDIGRGEELTVIYAEFSGVRRE